MAWVIPVLISVSCFGSLNGGVFTSARMYFVSARERQLPYFVSFISRKYNTPITAIIFNAFLAQIYLIIGNMYSLMAYMSFFHWLCDGASILGCIIWRVKYPDMKRPLKINLALPVFFCISSVFLVGASFYAKPVDCLIGLAMVFSAVPVYYLGIKHQDKQPLFIHKTLNSVTIFTQKMFDVVPEDTDKAS